MAQTKKHQLLWDLVEQAYLSSSQEFGAWMWAHHVPVVARKAMQLAEAHRAQADLAVAGALLHDFGDAYVHRFDVQHPQVTDLKSRELLKQAGYSEDEIQTVLEEVVAPHSCKNGVLPTTIEGKILATADAWAHLTTDFYLQFCWMHLPEGKSFEAYRLWVRSKIARDYHDKLFFDEVRAELRASFEAWQLVLGI